MNLALFLMTFVFGFMTAGSAGINFRMQIGLLIIFVFGGLNPQQPVPTHTIIDKFVGFITGMTIATVLGRLIWPVLPQMNPVKLRFSKKNEWRIANQELGYPLYIIPLIAVTHILGGVGPSDSHCASID